MLVSVEHIWKYFEADIPTLEDITFTVEQGERLGLVGVNGSGKTTLLQIITDRIGFDPTPGGDGAVNISKNCRVGYLEQNSGMSSESTVDAEMHRPFAGLEEEYKKMTALTEKMQELSGEELIRAGEEYSRLSAHYEANDGYMTEVKINTVLNGMGFRGIDRQRKINSLSGGERTRMALCKLLLESPDLLILDEPTNHLDLESTVWLEDYLSNYRGAVLTVSHNRYFLDRLCTRILELEDHKLKSFRGNYSDYVWQKKADLERQEKLYNEQQQKIKELQFYIDKNRASATSAKQAKNKQHMLDRIVDEGVEKPKKPKRPPKIRLEYDIEPPKEVFSAKNIDITVGEGESCRTLIDSLSFEIRRGEKVGIIGPNGIGKSSILKTIQGINPHSRGTVQWAMNTKIAYFDQKNEQLDPRRTVIDEVHRRYPRMTDQEVRTVLGGVLLSGENVYKPVGVISGGEKTKLSFAIMMLRRANVLILDEPTNHLDSMTCEVLEDALSEFAGTMILVSHDRYLLNKIATRIIEVSPGGVRSFEGNYDSYFAVKEAERIAAEEAEAARAAEKAAEQRERKKYRSREQRSQDVRRKQDLKDLENRIEALEGEISDIEKSLSDPETAADYVKMQDLCNRLEQAKAELDEAMESWVEASEQK